MGVKKDVMLMAAMMMAEMASPRERIKEEFIPIFCGDCVSCPTGNKTFCKLIGHKVSKTTPAHKCEHYRNKNIVED